MALTRDLGSSLAVKYGTIQTYVAGATSFGGATIVLRLATADDLVYAAVDDPSDAYRQLVVGFAVEGAVAGAQIRVRCDGKLRRKFPNMPSSVLGRLACILDDESVQLYGASTCKVTVGRISERASSTEVFIDITDRPQRLAASLID